MTPPAPPEGLPASAASVDRSSPLPLYVQIKRRLMQMITSWERPEDRFHTDEDLCALFGVSRMTVRQAVQSLVDEGYLTRARGVGTFVSRRQVDERFTPDMDFIGQWAGSGRPLVLQLRDQKRVPCPPEYLAALHLSSGAPILYLERLRFSTGVPISLDFRYILPEFGDCFTTQDVERFSLLDILRRRVELDRGEMRIEAKSADPETAEVLQILPGDPVLGRYCVYYDTGNRPVMAGYSICRSDQARYVVTMQLSRTSPATAQGFGSEWLS